MKEQAKVFSTFSISIFFSESLLFPNLLSQMSHSISNLTQKYSRGSYNIYRCSRNGYVTVTTICQWALVRLRPFVTVRDYTVKISIFFPIVLFTSFFLFSIAVLPHSPGVVYYHLFLRRETRIPGVAPFSF